MVLYLKYRPQKLSEVLGQENIIQTLKSAKAQNRLSHAYLFCGPRGVGKTSTARILAKIINCEKDGEDDCDVCKSIADGSNLDLIEIDAASNRGIDDVRELRERIKLSPTSLKKKVYIIDEVHMLTNEAFNALLKTLEEPPSHVIFILATTEPQKIPATILSRVTRLDFSGAASESLEQLLKKVVEKEKIEIEDEALSLLVKRADGSFRDGIKLLDQFSSMGGKITASLIEETLKGGNFETSVKLLELISQKDIKSALNLVNDEAKKGTNLKEYLYSLMDISRNLLLIQHQVDDLVKKNYSGEKYKILTQLSQSFSQDQLINLINSLLEATEKLKVSLIATLPIEVAIIESCSEKTVSKDEMNMRGDTEEGLPAQQSQVFVKNITEDGRRDTAVAGPRTSDVSDKPELVVPKAPSTLSDDLLTIREKWNYILETIKPYNFSLEAMLRTVKLDSAESDLVMLKVPYSFHQRILETPRNRDLLESVLADVLGKKVKVGCVLDQRPLKVEELANVELAADDEVIKMAAEIFNSDSA